MPYLMTRITTPKSIILNSNTLNQVLFPTSSKPTPLKSMVDTDIIEVELIPLTLTSTALPFPTFSLDF